MVESLNIIARNSSSVVCVDIFSSFDLLSPSEYFYMRSGTAAVLLMSVHLCTTIMACLQKRPPLNDFFNNLQDKRDDGLWEKLYVLGGLC